MEQTENMPSCIGFIMDGNRRWAREKNLDTLEGHQKGKEAFQTVVRTLRDREIAHGIFYAFSTENWGRSDREIRYLMKLFKGMLTDLLHDLSEEGVRIRIVGDRSRFTKDLQELMEEIEEKSSEYEKTTIWIALSYGGRAEIVDAVNRAIEAGEKITEDSFSELLWTKGMPDPDIIIRTSGEERLSNFLPWQSVYSEFFFVKTYWPDFGESELQSILEEYAGRKRRKGK